MSRGYFGIGIYYPKTEENVGTLWRSAYNFGAAFAFTIGRRCNIQPSDTVKSYRHFPLFNFKDMEEFQTTRPFDCPLIGIENIGKSTPLKNFKHPQRAIYLLGSESSGIPNCALSFCQEIVHVVVPETPARGVLNVSVAGSIVMYDRSIKS